ncbi:unnamed protein product, partial [Prorocentrum cordatum]
MAFELAEFRQGPFQGLHIATDGSARKDLEETHSQWVLVKLQVANNARSSTARFTHGTAGKIRTAGANALRIQMAAQKARIMGFQETRTPEGSRKAGGFHTISSGRDGKGVE